MEDVSSLLTLLAVIAFWLVGSFLVSDYAKNKGLNRDPYFYASIFFSPAIGFIAAAAAQPKPQTPAASPTKKCPECAEMVQQDAHKCRFCGFVFRQNGH